MIVFLYFVSVIRREYRMFYAQNCTVWLYQVFPHHIIKCTISEEKKILYIKCVLIVSTNLPETLVILRRIQLGILNNIEKWFRN
jgi:hypothetical protein